MSVYIDDDFKCHAFTEEGLEQVETDMIADGSDVSHLRFVPPGRTWTRLLTMRRIWVKWL
jgi:hypothetical protein